MAARELRRLSGDPLSATRAKFYGAGIVIVEPKPFYQRLFTGEAVAGAWHCENICQKSCPPRRKVVPARKISRRKNQNRS